jgi:hypothetical protein
MAEATDNLSYKERLAIVRYRSAVLVLAHQKAIKAVKAQFRAQGIWLGNVSNRTINMMADAWFEAHRDELITKAKNVIVTWPGFAYLRINAQKENEPKSTTSAVQISGAQ